MRKALRSMKMTTERTTATETMEKKRVTYEWRKHLLPYSHKATLRGRDGTLTLSETSLIFTPDEGEPEGVDVSAIRAVRPASDSLTVTWSSGGELKSMTFGIKEPDVDDSGYVIGYLRGTEFAFASRILTLNPQATAIGYKRVPDDEFAKKMQAAEEAVKRWNSEWDHTETDFRNRTLGSLHPSSGAVLTMPQALQRLVSNSDFNKKSLALTKGYAEPGNRRRMDNEESYLKEIELWPAPAYVDLVIV